MNDEAVKRTAPATPGLLKTVTLEPFKSNQQNPNRVNYKKV